MLEENEYWTQKLRDEQNWTSGYVEIWTLLFVEFYLLVNELSDNLVMGFCFYSFYNFFLKNTNNSKLKNLASSKY